jgi:hypothetical protein
LSFAASLTSLSVWRSSLEICIFWRRFVASNYDHLFTWYIDKR